MANIKLFLTLCLLQLSSIVSAQSPYAFIGVRSQDLRAIGWTQDNFREVLSQDPWNYNQKKEMEAYIPNN